MKKENKMGIILIIIGTVLCIAGAVLLILASSGSKKTNGDVSSKTTASVEQSSEKESANKDSKEDSKEETKLESTAQENSSDKKENNTETEEESTAESIKEESVEVSKEPEAEDTNALAVPSVCGALAVDGTQLVDSKGNPVQLRGISTHGIAWFPDYINEECVKSLREDWNANVFRIAMYTAENGGYCTDGNKEDLKNIVRRGVQYATAADMYVIIDWHVLRDTNPQTYKEEAKKFFGEMAKEYADYDNVLYEICNEPNSGTSWSDVKSYALEVIPVIREHDADAIILVGTPDWCQKVDQAAGDPITGYDNIMYTLHFYAATHKDGIRNTMVNALNTGLPIFVSEFSICDASGNGGIDYDQAQKWMDVINANGISYVQWSLANKNETSALLKSSCSKTSWFDANDLSDTGKWLYTQLTGESTVGNSMGNGGGNNNGNNGGNNNNGNNGGGNNNGNNGGNNNNGNNGGNANSGTAYTFSSGGLNGKVVLKSSWDEGGKKCYQFDLTLENPGSAITQWAIDIHFSENIGLTNGWGGNYSANGNTLHITSADYNGSIGAGATLSDLGFMVTGGSGLTVTP